MLGFFPKLPAPPKLGRPAGTGKGSRTETRGRPRGSGNARETRLPEAEDVFMPLNPAIIMSAEETMEVGEGSAEASGVNERVIANKTSAAGATQEDAEGDDAEGDAKKSTAGEEAADARSRKRQSGLKRTNWGIGESDL